MYLSTLEVHPSLPLPPLRSHTLPFLPLPLPPSLCSLLVVGDSVGRVKFFSNELKLLHWYDGRLGMGPLVSISFAYTSLMKDTPENTATLGYV